MADEKDLKPEETTEIAPAEEAEKKENASESAEEPKAEKKENAFSRFWKKTKQSVSDAVLEGKIRSAYEKAHAEFVIYEKDALIPTRVYGAVQDGSLTVFGKVEPKPCSVVIADNKEETAYYVVGTSETTVKSTVEGVEYEREGTVIALDEKVEEVRVVKAGKRYFIYKGEEKD